MGLSKLFLGSPVDLIFLDGTLEGLTSQLSVNKEEMLQVSNEAEAFFNRLYSVKGKNYTSIVDENNFRNIYLNFHGGGRFRNVTKTKGTTERPSVSLNFVGAFTPKLLLDFLIWMNVIMMDSWKGK